MTRKGLIPRKTNQPTNQPTNIVSYPDRAEELANIRGLRDLGDAFAKRTLADKNECGCGARDSLQL